MKRMIYVKFLAWSMKCKGGAALLMACAFSLVCTVQAYSQACPQGLKDAYRDYWRMGVSVNQWEVSAELGQQGRGGGVQAGDFAVIGQHFDWLVAENCMKCETIHPQEDVYDFTLADQLVDLARSRGMHVIGHCLVWHSQCAKWFFVDDEGKQVSADVLKKRLHDHIFTILDHFRGRVEGWDVVNEAFNDDGSLRRSKFYEILGEEYISLAFQYAHDADPTVELYYNDYSMNNPAKCDGVVGFFRPLVEKGLPIDAIGMQGHMTLGDADYVTQYERSINAITSIGLKTQFTELDLSVLPSPWGFSGANVGSDFDYRKRLDPYPDGLPESVQRQADDLWLRLFKMLLPYKDNILRMGFWCLNDGNSWRNGFPVKGRTDYATLFDRQNRPKPAVQKLIDLVAPSQADADTTSVSLSSLWGRTLSAYASVPKVGAYFIGKYAYSDQAGQHGGDGFSQRFIRAYVDGTILNDFKYRIQVQVNNSTFHMKDYFIEWSHWQELAVKVGQYKRAFLFENPYNPWDVGAGDYSQIARQLAGIADKDGNVANGGRDQGVQVQGDLFPSKRDGHRYLHYQLQVMNGQGINSSDANARKDFIGSLQFQPIRNLSFGIFGWTGNYVTADGVTLDRNRWAASVRYERDGWAARAEYAHSQGHLHADGWYATLGVPFNRWLQLYAKYDTYRPQKTWGSMKTIYSLIPNFQIHKHLLLQLQYNHVHDRLLMSPDYNEVWGEVYVRF